MHQGSAHQPKKTDGNKLETDTAVKTGGGQLDDREYSTDDGGLQWHQ